jgi:hypothetical protein
MWLRRISSSRIASINRQWATRRSGGKPLSLNRVRNHKSSLSLKVANNVLSLSVMDLSDLETSDGMPVTSFGL